MYNKKTYLNFFKFKEFTIVVQKLLSLQIKEVVKNNKKMKLCLYSGNDNFKPKVVRENL